ncbi:serine/threonine-protein kinase [Jonesia quinghaiensis]|uniref:serine/threonine-protein kinase n=1 Tax=Jonesia quinghaiensis TaxID=262806 RepID=UPI000413C0C0|nr:serine/threonine-protein kinase [Jonesia quinghaiensis]
MKAAPGVAFSGRYRLVRQIAVGGMGEVWVARDESLARDIAVKVLKPEFVGNTDFLARFRTEARNAASLSHANIAQLYDYGEQGGSAYLVMELVSGEPMSDLLEREPVLNSARLLSILAQTARALHAAHVGGVVHRDIKPGNILLEHGGEVKITDFGVSLAANQIPMTAAGMVMGTAQYLSPEQAVGRPATGASDIYALGIVAYEAIAGNRPFTGKTPVDIAVAHVNEQVPPLPKNTHPDLATLVMKMLAKDPLERPRSGAALAHTFEDLARKIAENPWPVSTPRERQNPDPTRHHSIEDTGPQIFRGQPRPGTNQAPARPSQTPLAGGAPPASTRLNNHGGPGSRPPQEPFAGSPSAPHAGSQASAPEASAYGRAGAHSGAPQVNPQRSVPQEHPSAGPQSVGPQSTQRSRQSNNRPRLNPDDYDELGATRPRGQLSDLKRGGPGASSTGGNTSTGGPHSGRSAQSAGGSSPRGRRDTTSAQTVGSSPRSHHTPPAQTGLLDRVRNLGWFTLTLVGLVVIIMLATLVKGLVSPGSSQDSANRISEHQTPVEFISALPITQGLFSQGETSSFALIGKDVQW